MTNSGLKVSVNIPIYNASKFLRRCLESMRCQTLKDIEFVLIDDGSTDDSLQICNEYANLDSRFKVYHKSNGGSASARQMALDYSSGEYIIVCDADDWVEPEMYELLYEAAKMDNADISTCDYFINYQDGKQAIATHSIDATSAEQFLKDVLTKKIPPASWIKLIRKAFLLDNNISYEEGINLGEDYLFLVKIALCNPNVAKLNKPLYHYRRIINGPSYTNAPKYVHFQQMESVYIWISQNLDSLKYGKEIFNLAVDVAFLGIRVSDMNTAHYKNFIDEHITCNACMRYRSFNLKSMIVYFTKISRPVSVLVYRKLSKYFYK